MDQLQLFERIDETLLDNMLWNLSHLREKWRDHLSDSRVVLLFSPGIYFSVSFSDTASLSARISHQDSADDTRFCRQGECCRLNCNETFSRLLSFFVRLIPRGPQSPPSSFSSLNLEDPTPSFVDLFSSADFWRSLDVSLASSPSLLSGD